MKKIFRLTVLAMACISLFAACNKNNFKKTDNGLLYRFETVNNEGDQPQIGDVLVVELTWRLDSTVLFSNVGKPDRLMQVRPDMFKGDINEGLLMMHMGDKATFAIPADSIAKFMQPNQMPPSFQQGTDQKYYYEISLVDIVTREELEQEQANFVEEMNKRQAEEPALIAQYIKDNNITVKPTASGLYVIVRKKGNGPKVEAGKDVSIDYTGRLLDGTVFDSSREADALEAGLVQQGRKYEPLSYKVGAQPLIKGWDEGVMGQTEGSEITLVIPSEIAYGSRGSGKDILPFTPLVFDLTILEVK